jgi:hypothetical protein
MFHHISTTFRFSEAFNLDKEKGACDKAQFVSRRHSGVCTQPKELPFCFTCGNISSSCFPLHGFVASSNLRDCRKGVHFKFFVLTELLLSIRQPHGFFPSSSHFFHFFIIPSMEIPLRFWVVGQEDGSPRKG